MHQRLVRAPGAPPLYAQIAELLQSRIVREGLRPGDRLDSEPQLTKALGVSRATVAKALDQLVRNGMVERRQGHGTFVARYPLDRRLPELTGFSEHITSLGLTAGQRFVDYRRAFADPHGEDTLLAGFPEGAEVVVARRVRLVGAEPAGLHRTAVPADIADAIGFDEEALRGQRVSLYALFGAHGVQLARAEEHLQARTADAEEARLLGVAHGTALMHVRRLSRDSSDRLVEAVDARYVGGFYDYRIELVRSKGPDTATT